MRYFNIRKYSDRNYISEQKLLLKSTHLIQMLCIFHCLTDSFEKKNYPRRIKLSGQGCGKRNNRNITINVTSAHIHNWVLEAMRLQDHDIYLWLLCECICYYVKNCVLDWLKLCIWKYSLWIAVVLCFLGFPFLGEVQDQYSPWTWYRPSSIQHRILFLIRGMTGIIQQSQVLRQGVYKGVYGHQKEDWDSGH